MNYQQKFKDIDNLKTQFNELLCKSLNLIKVPAPLFVSKDSGLNDNLTGTEEKVNFLNYEVVQSLAKWKRYALNRYNLIGICTDMVALRQSEKVDKTHSIQVEQWDWEFTISEEERTLDKLYETVKIIFNVIKEVDKNFNNILKNVNSLFYDSFENLGYKYPYSLPEDIVNEVVKTHKIAFFSKITTERAPDYDDWNLNGDLYVWNDILNAPLELMSCGIRVDSISLTNQAMKTNTPLNTPYHKLILKNQLPFTIGGGIGKNRLCMYLLKMKDISEYIEVV